MTPATPETPVLVVWRNRSLETRPNARAYESLFTPDDPATLLAFTINYIAATKHEYDEVIDSPDPERVFRCLDASSSKKPVLLPVQSAKDILGWDSYRLIDITDSEALVPPHPDGIGGLRAVS